VTHDPFIGQQAVHFALAKARDLRHIEAGERGSEVVSLGKNGPPTEPRPEGLEAQFLEQAPVVTATNIAQTGGIAFAPLQFGFHSGVFDDFNLGGVAGPGIDLDRRRRSRHRPARGLRGRRPDRDARHDPARRPAVGGSVSETFAIDTTLNATTRLTKT
jgi:hypothetical protein